MSDSVRESRLLGMSSEDVDLIHGSWIKSRMMFRSVIADLILNQVQDDGVVQDNVVCLYPKSRFEKMDIHVHVY